MKRDLKKGFAVQNSQWIVYDEEILGGTPVFTGTRVPIKTLFDYLGKNYPLSEFLDDFPTVLPHQARAVLAQAATAVKPEKELVRAGTA